MADVTVRALLNRKETQLNLLIRLWKIFGLMWGHDIANGACPLIKKKLAYQSFVSQVVTFCC